MACGDDAAAPADEPVQDASTLDASTLDAHATDDARIDDEVMTTDDRCYGEQCVPSRLPQQEDLEWLEPMGDGWLRLMEADWEVAPNAEGYRCMTLTIPEDIYITAFYPQSPQGTHHSTFTVTATATEADGVVACGVGVIGERRLRGSGAGTEPSDLPEGVAQPLRAGEQVTMNLHLFNVTEEPLHGRSGMWVKTVAAGDVEHESEMILAGPLDLLVPVGESTQIGTCTLTADVTLFALGPHMHQTGSHMRVTAMTATGEVELHDAPYDFTHQVNYDIDPVTLAAGDVVTIECTYQNPTDSPIEWGDSSLDEMCFIGLNVYPATGASGGLPCSS
jgi:hypothetical protein